MESDAIKARPIAFMQRHELGVIATASTSAVPEAALVNIAVTPSFEIVFETTAATRLIGVTATASAAMPVIYLSREGGADYRIYVQSKTFTVQDAAALVVSAHRAPARLAASL